MCGVVDEPVTELSNRERRARKEHLCCACGERIQQGHRYHEFTAVWEGALQTYRHCRRCWKMLTLIQTELNWGEPVDLTLDCGETWESATGQCTPEHIEVLAFVTPAEMQERPTP